jgi:hypothetical protein
LRTVRPKKDEEAGGGVEEIGTGPGPMLLLAALEVVTAMVGRAGWPVAFVTWTQPISEMSAIAIADLREVPNERLGERIWLLSGHEC